MCGRAGRRGIDEKGNIVIYFKDPEKMPEKDDFKKMVDHKVILFKEYKGRKYF